MCPQLTQHRLTQLSASTAAGQALMPGFRLVPSHSCAHATCTQTWALPVPYTLFAYPMPFSTAAHHEGPAQMSPPLGSYLLAPMVSHFLLWDPSA